ncbi:hypothetical protein HHK36_006729 [Tetracentron sinense]|uniref:Uncharacterized protein n=1 Tax=Tetracentron sinense TaxID=13715 RepID=A0A834ZL30_TETSI|nr:hypothetical protein HHK36_006729 [Tetracentron sinense]
MNLWEEMENSNRKEEGILNLGFPIHSQIRKIKQEYEKITELSPTETEMRPVLHGITRQKQQQRSRSPLGISRQPISVGL